MSKKDLYAADGMSHRGKQRVKLKMAKITSLLPKQDHNPTHKKFYSTYIWQKSRDRKIKGTPLCEFCRAEGRLVPATLVHHIQALEFDGEQLNQDNLMSLCGEYHHRKIHSMMDEDIKEGITTWTRESILSRIPKTPR